MVKQLEKDSKMPEYKITRKEGTRKMEMRILDGTGTASAAKVKNNKVLVYLDDSDIERIADLIVKKLKEPKE